MSYDDWKCREPDNWPADDEEADMPDDASIERLLEDARLGDTVASVTLVEACERALAADASEEESRSARGHIRDYLNARGASLTTVSPPDRSSSSKKTRSRR